MGSKEFAGFKSLLTEQSITIILAHRKYFKKIKEATEFEGFP